MSHTDTGMRAAGAWLAIASVLLGLVLIGHGPIHPDLGQQMKVIAEGSTRWAIVHWAAAAAVAEATVVANAAAAGDLARFEAWWAFSEGKATGFMFVALAVAVLADNEARTAQPITRAWASLIAIVAGIGAFVGWPLGMWFGIELGSLIWVASSFVVALWTLWFGLGLARAEINVQTASSARSSA